MSGPISITPVGEPESATKVIHVFTPNRFTPLCWTVEGGTERGTFDCTTNTDEVTCSKCIEWMHA